MAQDISIRTTEDNYTFYETGIDKPIGDVLRIDNLCVRVGNEGQDVDLEVMGLVADTYLKYDATLGKLTYKNTCSTTNGSTSYEPVRFDTIMTGAGQVGGRVRVNMESNVKLGGWANAFKAEVDLDTSGGVSGLLSAICGELTLPTTSGDGTLCVFEGEITCPATWVGTNPTSFFYLASSGASKANFDTYGYLFTLVGMASGVSNFWYDHNGTAGGDTIGEWIRVKTPNGDKWLGLYDTVH